MGPATHTQLPGYGKDVKANSTELRLLALTHATSTFCWASGLPGSLAGGRDQATKGDCLLGGQGPRPHGCGHRLLSGFLPSLMVFLQVRMPSRPGSWPQLCGQKHRVGNVHTASGLASDAWATAGLSTLTMPRTSPASTVGRNQRPSASLRSSGVAGVWGGGGLRRAWFPASRRSTNIYRGSTLYRPCTRPMGHTEAACERQGVCVPTGKPNWHIGNWARWGVCLPLAVLLLQAVWPDASHRLSQMWCARGGWHLLGYTSASSHTPPVFTPRVCTYTECCIYGCSLANTL